MLEEKFLTPRAIDVFLGCIKCTRCRLLLPIIAVTVCQSVCHPAQLGFTAKTAEQIKILFGVNTLRGPRNIVLDGGS